MEKYERHYEIASYECNENGHLRLRSLFNLFQDSADTHANIIGVGYSYCKQNHLGWVGGGYHVEILKMPAWRDQVILRTWPSKTTAATAIREFELTDADTNEVLVRASSQWILIDATKHRPVCVLPHLKDMEPIAERSVNTLFEKLPAPERADVIAEEIVRVDDIDLNQHVNNAVYPSWVLDALPADFTMRRKLKEIQIQYKYPVQKGDTIKVKTQMDENTGLHVITNGSSTLEFARIKTVWQFK